MFYTTMIANVSTGNQHVQGRIRLVQDNWVNKLFPVKNAGFMQEASFNFEGCYEVYCFLTSAGNCGVYVGDDLHMSWNFLYWMWNVLLLWNDEKKWVRFLKNWFDSTTNILRSFPFGNLLSAVTNKIKISIRKFIFSIYF